MRINKNCLITALLTFGLWPINEGLAEITREVPVNEYAGCWKITAVKYEENGYFTLKFKALRNPVIKQFCADNLLYDVRTGPEDQIRGSKGVSGRNPSNLFFIQVTPVTKVITLKYRYRGKIHTSTVKLVKHINAVKRMVRAETSAPSWQKSFKRSETKLSEIAIADKTPPIIILHSPDVSRRRQLFRVDTYQTFIRGKIKDDTGVAVVLVNGTRAGVKADGTFAKKVKLAIGTNKMNVQAEDIHGNVAERNFTIVREEFIPDTIFADVDIPKKTRMSNPDGIAVVIGVESYQYVSNATYAYNDAEVFREYLANTLGFRKSRIKIVTNSKATQAEMNKLLGPNGWIARNLKIKKSDVVVYYSGHGIPDAKTKKTGLLPFDVDPNYSIGLKLKDLYKTLGGLNARSVTVFLDTCFSGQGRENQSLLADTRGIQIVRKERSVPGNITVLSAATAGQFSGPLKDKEHGLFTYYLLKGLGGAADGNRDKKITIAELAKYVRLKVKEDAALKGREQTPELQGGGKRVLVTF